MKKILFITLLVLIGIVSKAQNNGYVSKITDYMILQGDTIRLDTASLQDGQVLKRVNGVWQNDTVGAGSAAIDSLLYDNGYIYWYSSGSIADSTYIDDLVRYSDSTITFVTPTQLSNAIGDAEKNTYEITVPASEAISGRITGATLPPGWSISVGTSPVDLEISHGEGRRVAFVTIWSISGDIETQLYNAAAYATASTLDLNTLLLSSFSRVDTALKIYITFL